MKNHILLFKGLLFTVCLLCSVYGSAQTNFQKAGIDSAAIQKKVDGEYKKKDSILKGMEARRKADSLAVIQNKIKQQKERDSIQNARIAKRIADSIAREEAKLKLIKERKTRDSLLLVQKKRTEDSLAYIKFKADSTAKVQREINDSLMARRKFMADSTRLARDSARAVREAIAKYKNSKRYKDSVETRKAFVQDSIKQDRLAKAQILKEERKRVSDSIRTAQENYRDSIATLQKNTRDSLAAIQKANMDKIKAERDKYNDSVKTVRTKKADSLKTVREEREKKLAAKSKEQTKEKQELKLAIDIHQKKTEEWTNEKLLKRKWSLHRRLYQNTVTRYNAYYHAKRKYDESITSLVKANKEDYIKPISIYKYDVTKQGSSVAGNMDSIIKKASYSTQIHDPRSKWFDNLYMLMAQAYHVKNDFDGAITTLQFVINEYKDEKKSNKKAIDTSASIASVEKNRKLLKWIKHKPVRNEAILLLVKTYILTDQFGEAQTMISLLEKDKVLPKKYLPQLYLNKAHLQIAMANNAEAIPALETALKYKMKESQKSRVRFLLGQLLSLEKEYDKSTAYYKKSFYKKNAPEMDFFTKLHIAENAAQGGGDINYAVNQLQKIIKDGKYSKYKSQALMTLAMIQKPQNIDKAIENLNKSIQNADNKDKFLKAQAFAALGNIYYEQYNYAKAKNCLDSAIFLGEDPPLENLNEITLTRNVLIDIVQYMNIIRKQDSLLTLSNMSEKDKKAAVKKYAEMLSEEQKKKTDAVKVETLQPIDTKNGLVKSNWYFSNNDLKEKGIKEFKQKWGTRKLEDNWRRSATTNSNLAGDADLKDMEGLSDENAGAVQDLWAAIPTTQAKKDSCHYKIMNAYYGLGLAYYSQLQDYQNSINVFDTLINKYPKTDYKPEVYYAQYLNYTQLKNDPKAEYYRNLLITSFPNSDLSKLTQDSKFKEQELKKLQSNYENTYSLYKEAKYQDALNEITQVNDKNPLIAKYKLIEAFCHAGLKDMPKAKSGLMALITQYPSTEEQQRAQEVLSYMNKIENEKIGDSTNTVNSAAGVQENLNEVEKSEGKGNFTLNNETEHYVLIYLNNADGKTIAFKSGLSDYNLLKHNVEEYSTGLNYLTTTKALVTVQKFSNKLFAYKYMNDLKKEKLVFSQLKSSEYDIMIISKDNFMEVLKTRDILGYRSFYKSNY